VAEKVTSQGQPGAEGAATTSSREESNMFPDTQLLDKKFEETEPSTSGQLPGEDPFKLHVHLRNSLTKTASSQAAPLQVRSGPNQGQCLWINPRGWAVLSPSYSTKFVLVPYYADHYVVVASGSWANYYLSYNDRSYVGAYSAWSSARYWAVEPLDCSNWPGLYPYNKGDQDYLCVNGVEDKKLSELVELFAVR
jgi:hypothetical protein